MTARYTAPFASPLGTIELISDGEALLSARFDMPAVMPSLPPPAVLEQAVQWLTGYFAGETAPCTLPLRPEGTTFQRAVWEALTHIPYGQTASYGSISRVLCSSPRAVGQAAGKNPLLIFVPCHRLIGANGALTGFAAGIERKKALLEMERQHHAPNR